MTFSKGDPGALEAAATCLTGGGIAILPTDTVYGLSGLVDTRFFPSHKTDRKIRAAKGRPEDKPFIQLLSEPSDIWLYTDDVIPAPLLDKWPGALTIIVHVRPGSPLVDPPGTVAFRCPGDEWLRRVIGRCGAPVYSTSVNRSGSPVLDTVDAIAAEFGGVVDLFVTDGDRRNAVPSTVVALDGGRVRMLRQGAVPIDVSSTARSACRY